MMTVNQSETPESALNQFAKVSRLCSLCSRMCRHSCPTHLVTRSDACSPVGRALIVELYRGGITALTEAAVDRLYQCNLCSACKAWCKYTHELPRIIELARERVIKEYRTPQGVVDLTQSVTDQNNVYNEPHAKRFALLSKSLRQPHADAKVIYFVGCTTAYRHPEIAEATAKILSRLGIIPQIMAGMDGEVCCGSPLLRAGAIDTARTVAQHNVNAIIQSGIRTVVTTCPGCARALKLDYPQLGVPLPKQIRVLHITEFLMKYHHPLSKLLTKSIAGKTNGAYVKVAYHDPCHLGRELGVYEPPRQLLSLLPNVELVEFTHNREHADCCGGGGVLPKTFFDMSVEIGKRRLDSATNTDASYLASCCPNCKQHFTITQEATSSSVGLQPIDLMEILASSMK